MPAKYIPRLLGPVLERASTEFPAVVLTGPRQSGKTTLLRHLFDASHTYVSLEPPDVRASASADPRGFLRLYRPPVIFDEVQYAPDLLPYVKEVIDEHRSEPGQFILTGSQNLLVMDRVTESLAGRAAMLRLLPLTHREAGEEPNAPLPWETKEARRTPPSAHGQALWDLLIRGWYPELVAGPRRDVGLWHASYVQTYLERDVRNIRQVGDLTSFQSFLRALAARSAQLLNLTDLARDVGISVNTAKAWLSVLEATFQVVVLRPYFANVGKRLAKRPKAYFTDVGVLCYLLGVGQGRDVTATAAAGAVFETAVFSEIFKAIAHRGQDPHIYFWRTLAGVEVDILVESREQLVPVEAKLSATPRPAMASGIRALQADLADKISAGYVVHPGDTRLPLAPNVLAVPFADL